MFGFGFFFFGFCRFLKNFLSYRGYFFPRRAVWVMGISFQIWVLNSHTHWSTKGTQPSAHVGVRIWLLFISLFLRTRDVNGQVQCHRIAGTVVGLTPVKFCREAGACVLCVGHFLTRIKTDLLQLLLYQWGTLSIAAVISVSGRHKGSSVYGLTVYDIEVP